MDASNMLKPMLARGELHCIGATTLDEYRQYVEKDAALERRFQMIIVEPPSKEETVEILRGLRASRKAPGHESIYTAGEEEHLASVERASTGVPLNASLRREMLTMREELVGYVVDITRSYPVARATQTTLAIAGVGLLLRVDRQLPVPVVVKPG